MKIKNRIYIMTLFFLLINILILLPAFLKSSKQYPTATKGMLDITNWDFDKEGAVKLDGQWEFYWNQLLSYDDFHGDEKNYKLSGYVDVPKVWNKYKIDGKELTGNGYATYRLRVKTNNLDDIKGLKILNLSTSYKLMINNDMIASNGVVGKSKDTAIPEYRPQAVSFKNDAESFEIIVQISNYTYSRGGLWYAIYLGTDSQIRNMKENSSRREMFLLGCILIMILYHIAIYCLQKRDTSVIYLILALFTMMARIAVTGEYFITSMIPSININFMVFIEYITIYWGPTMWVAFFHKLYPKESSKRIFKILIYIALILTIFIVVTPIHIYTKFLIYYEILVVVMFCYILVSLFFAVLKKKEGAYVLFLGTVTLFTTLVNDALYHWGVIESEPGGMFGFVAFVIIFIQAYVLAARFSKAFLEVEKLSDKMISINKIKDEFLANTSNKIKDEFLANTSHELRTPLHGIISIIESVLQEKDNGLSQKQRENLFLVVSSGRRLANLINDILDYSKLKYGDIKLNKKEIDIGKIVQMALDLYRYIAVNKSIILKNNIVENLPLVLADEERITQIMYNLIGNAMKFTEKGMIIVSAVEKNDMLEISVEDTGIGIAEEKLDDIFKSFEQVETSLKKKAGGTGLGLSITKHLVEMHGGKIWVVSDVEKGSKFTFSIPKSKGINIQINNEIIDETSFNYNTIYQEISSTLETLENDGEFTILIVDDDYVNLQALVNILSAEKYSIMIATDGMKALDIINKNRKIDLVILDIMMPKISGVEVCREIRKKSSLHDLPIIMLTAQNNPNAIFVGLEAGANDFLSKPFDVSELKARVKTLLQLKKSVQYAINAEMAFLQAQIKPHFLYNALNTIVSLCWIEPEKAGEILLELSNYLRSSFAFNNMDKFIQAREEIEFIRSYLAIEKARFGERLNYHFDFDDEDLDFMIPNHILQPIVENSIKHGILQKAEGGNIIISLSSEDEYIVIKIIDDGIGIQDEKLQNLMKCDSENKRIGIKNINTRMKRIYGYGIEIESRLGKGTKTSIRIPRQGG